MKKLLFVVLALLLCATLVYASEPIYDHFVYLPAVVGGSGGVATPTPTVTATPTIEPTATLGPPPTDTPPWTSTSTPTPGTVVLPTVTPTPGPDAWADNGYLYGNSDRLYVLGEVHNGLTSAISWPIVPVTIYASGQPVYLGEEWTPRTVGAGGSVCFEHIVWSPPAVWDSFEFGPVTHYGGMFVEYSPDLPLTDLRGTYYPDSKPWPGDFIITGNVTSDESVIVRYISLTAMLKDAEGRVVGCQSTSLGTDLLPGMSAPFTIQFSGYRRDYGDVVAYHLQTYGTLAE